MWVKRKTAEINMAHQNMEDEGEKQEVVNAEIQKALNQHDIDITMPGVVPQSAKYLNNADADGNQLWRITVMRKQAAEYIRLLKKNGMQA